MVPDYHWKQTQRASAVPEPQSRPGVQEPPNPYAEAGAVYTSHPRKTLTGPLRLMKAITDADLGPRSGSMKGLLHALATMTDFTLGTCHPSFQTLARRTAFAVSTVHSLMSKAVKLGYVTKIRGGGGPAMRTNKYMLNVVKLESLAARRQEVLDFTPTYGSAMAPTTELTLSAVRENTPSGFGGQPSDCRRAGVQTPEARPPGVGNDQTKDQTREQTNQPSTSPPPVRTLGGGGGNGVVDGQCSGEAVSCSHDSELSLHLLEQFGVCHSKAKQLAPRHTPEEIREGMRLVKRKGTVVRDPAAMLVFTLDDGTARVALDRRRAAAPASGVQTTPDYRDALHGKRVDVYLAVFEHVAATTSPSDAEWVNCHVTSIKARFASPDEIARSGILSDNQLFSTARYWDLFNEIVRLLSKLPHRASAVRQQHAEVSS